MNQTKHPNNYLLHLKSKSMFKLFFTFIIVSGFISFNLGCSHLKLIFFNTDPTKLSEKVERLISEEKELHPFAIWQGLTTETETEIKVLAKKNEVINFKVFYNDKEIKSLMDSKVTAGETEFVIYSLALTNLESDTNYTLQIFKENQIIDQRNFSTLSASLKKPKIGIVSCSHDKLVHLQYEMWNEYLKLEPTYTFMIGDNVYADTLISSEGKVYKFKHASEATLWKRYVESFNTYSYFRSGHLVPTLGIWDDHDYGFNNGDSSYPFKKQSLKVFESFYGFSKKSENVVDKLEGAGYVFEAFKTKFFFIDGRTFRSTKKENKKNKESHLGIAQTEKIFSILKPTDTAWFIKGDQFFGGYSRFESFENDHPKDFIKFKDRLKNLNAKVFFVSGDRHLNELMKIDSKEIGYETFEITSSAIHASVFPDAWKGNPNPRQMAGASGVPNFSLVEINIDDPKALEVTSYGPKRKILFKKNIVFGIEPQSKASELKKN